jgi:hypothetical protein
MEIDVADDGCQVVVDELFLNRVSGICFLELAAGPIASYPRRVVEG